MEYHKQESPKRGVDLYFGGSILFYSCDIVNKPTWSTTNWMTEVNI